MCLFRPSLFRAWRHLTCGRSIVPRDSFSEGSLRRCCPASFCEDKSDHSWTCRLSCGTPTRLVDRFHRTSPGGRVTGLHRVQQSRCAGGSQTHAQAWTPPPEETAQCVGKGSDAPRVLPGEILPVFSSPSRF